MANVCKNKLIEVREAIRGLMTQRTEEPAPRQKVTDATTIVKYLSINASLLRSTRLNKLLPTLRTLKDTVIEEQLLNVSDTVRCKALECYGLCCIMDKETAKNGIHIMSAPVSTGCLLDF